MHAARESNGGNNRPGHASQPNPASLIQLNGTHGNMSPLYILAQKLYFRWITKLYGGGARADSLRPPAARARRYSRERARRAWARRGAAAARQGRPRSRAA